MRCTPPLAQEPSRTLLVRTTRRLAQDSRRTLQAQCTQPRAQEQRKILRELVRSEDHSAGARHCDVHHDRRSVRHCGCWRVVLHHTWPWPSLCRNVSSARNSSQMECDAATSVLLATAVKGCDAATSLPNVLIGHVMVSRGHGQRLDRSTQLLMPTIPLVHGWTQRQLDHTKTLWSTNWHFDHLVYGWPPRLVGHTPWHFSYSTCGRNGHPTMEGSLNFTRCEASLPHTF